MLINLMIRAFHLDLHITRSVYKNLCNFKLSVNIPTICKLKLDLFDPYPNYLNLYMHIFGDV